MFKNIPAFLLFIMLAGPLEAQHIRILTTGFPVSLRGLSVVSDRVIWVSGSGGSVGRSADGGKTWKWIRVPRYEKSDFRDIEAFSDQEAVIMAVTEPAAILRTTDGGKSWKTVFEDSAKSVFLDAMDFSGNQGTAIGDPVDGKIFFAGSADKGKSWNRIIFPGYETVATGEAFFAASGSNIRRTSPGSWALVSGGKKSCLYLLSGRYPLLISQGEETTGANSVAINPADPNQAFIVGGDFSHDTVSYRNSLRIRLHPFSQEFPLTPPRGYRSCVEYIDGKRMICCGPTGVDISSDGGNQWKGISGIGFHVCRRSKTGRVIFLAGTRGRIARLEWEEPTPK
jgi:hypothetical protein